MGPTSENVGYFASWSRGFGGTRTFNGSDVRERRLCDAAADKAAKPVAFNGSDVRERRLFDRPRVAVHRRPRLQWVRRPRTSVIKAVADKEPSSWYLQWVRRPRTSVISPTEEKRWRQQPFNGSDVRERRLLRVDPRRIRS